MWGEGEAPASRDYITMGTSSAEVPALRRNTAIRELSHGRELTRRLRVLLRQMPPDDLRCEPASVLSLEILRSVTAALSSLESAGEGSPARSQTSDSGLSGSNAAAEKRRGHSEKGEPHSWTELTAMPYHDGHQWRKYGQKRIAGARFSRSYYRCTYSDVEGCNATKQVQRAEGEDGAHAFLVKYTNKHTCRNRLMEPPLDPYSIEPGRNSEGDTGKTASIISFGTNQARWEECPLLSFSSSSSSNQDIEDGAPISLPGNCSPWEGAASMDASLQASEADGGFLSGTSGLLRDVGGGGLDGGLLHMIFPPSWS